MSDKNFRQTADNSVKRPYSIPTAAQDSISQRYTPEHSVRQPQQKKSKSRADKRLKAAGLVFIALFIVSTFFVPSSAGVTSSAEAALALESGISTELPLGTRLLLDDQNLGGQDLTITHSSAAEETKIHIWDYAAEDGDYVQVLVNGIPLGDPFMIHNKPVELTVPTTGEITVVGTHDGGGGITYAVHYDINGTTYYNGTDVGEGNVYTLIRE